MRIELKTLARSTVEKFAEDNGLTMIVSERDRALGAGDRFYAKFDDAEVMVPGGFLRGEFGNGATPYDAIKSYAREISGKKIAIGAMLKTRRELEVPILIEL